MNGETPGNSGEELYARFLAGDEAALTELIGLYRTGLMLFLYDMVGDMDHAEDLMIDAFTRLAVNGKRFEGRSSLKTYLYTIGKNLALRHRKKREKENHASLEEVGRDIAGSGAIESELLRDETRRQTYTALQALKAEHRQVLLLVYFNDMSYAEAGAVLRKTETQVSGLVYRAKAALKRALESGGFIYED